MHPGRGVRGVIGFRRSVCESGRHRAYNQKGAGGVMLTIFVIFVAMLLIVAVAGLVIVYTVFPHRGQKMPYATKLG